MKISAQNFQGALLKIWKISKKGIRMRNFCRLSSNIFYLIRFFMPQPLRWLLSVGNVAFGNNFGILLKNIEIIWAVFWLLRPPLQSRKTKVRKIVFWPSFWLISSYLLLWGYLKWLPIVIFELLEIQPKNPITPKPQDP